MCCSEDLSKNKKEWKSQSVRPQAITLVAVWPGVQYCQLTTLVLNFTILPTLGHLHIYDKGLYSCGDKEINIISCFSFKRNILTEISNQVISMHHCCYGFNNRYSCTVAMTHPNTPHGGRPAAEDSCDLNVKVPVAKANDLHVPGYLTILSDPSKPAS